MISPQAQGGHANIDHIVKLLYRKHNRLTDEFHLLGGLWLLGAHFGGLLHHHSSAFCNDKLYISSARP